VTLTLHHAVRSDVGHVREGNEDAGYGSLRLLAVADGMGGAAAGEVASKVVIGRLAALGGTGLGVSQDALGALQGALLTANQDLRDFVAADPDLEGMGTTVTALLSEGSKIALAHIGDSRAYLMREGTLTQITRDHTYVQALVDDGQITPEEAAVHPQRNMITRVLDGRVGVELDVSLRDARKGDRYLLCTDGLSGVVTTETIAAALELPSVEEAAERLVDLALRGGGPDNITVIVADLVEVDSPGYVEEDEPVVAGAAAEGPEPVRPAASAAARAALAAGQANRTRAAAPEEWTEGRIRRVLGTLALPLLALVVIAAGLLGTWLYIQHQYYVGVNGTRVAIYRGISGSVGPIHLSKVERIEMPVQKLQPYYRQRVESGIDAKNLTDAESIVATLRGEEVVVARPLRHPHPKSGPVAPSTRATPTAAATKGSGQ
jgi:protein phosphatase